MKNRKITAIAISLCCFMLLCLMGCQKEQPHTHTPAEDDGDCTTKVRCTVCDEVVVKAQKSHVDGDTDGVCDNCPKVLDYLYDQASQTYTVYTVKGLYAWAEKRQNLILAKDIVLPEEMQFDLDGDGYPESNWKPISNLQGVVDGNGHRISNLVIKTTRSNVGFLDYMTKGQEVRNLHLVNVKIEGDVNVGGIAGMASQGLITNCSVSGVELVAKNNAGGIVGTGSDTKVVACRNDAVITAKGLIGGIIGQYNGGEITACFNTGEIRTIGDSYGASAGGIVGTCFAGTIRACYSTGTVRKGEGSNPQAGGIVGYDSGTLLENYWSTEEAGAPEFGSGRSKNNENAEKTEDWESAMNAMNAALESVEAPWRYAVNAEGCPLVLTGPEEAE